MENKKDITACLCATLKRTREYNDLTDLIYYAPGEVPNAPDEEYVLAIFQAPRPHKRICVTADSGAALILDVMKGLMNA